MAAGSSEASSITRKVPVNPRHEGMSILATELPVDVVVNILGFLKFKSLSEEELEVKKSMFVSDKKTLGDFTAVGPFQLPSIRDGIEHVSYVACRKTALELVQKVRKHLVLQLKDVDFSAQPERKEAIEKYIEELDRFETEVPPSCNKTRSFAEKKFLALMLKAPASFHSLFNSYLDEGMEKLHPLIQCVQVLRTYELNLERRFDRTFRDDALEILAKYGFEKTVVDVLISFRSRDHRDDLYEKSVRELFAHLTRRKKLEEAFTLAKGCGFYDVKLLNAFIDRCFSPDAEGNTHAELALRVKEEITGLHHDILGVVSGTVYSHLRGEKPEKKFDTIRDIRPHVLRELIRTGELREARDYVLEHKILDEESLSRLLRAYVQCGELDNAIEFAETCATMSPYAGKKCTFLHQSGLIMAIAVEKGVEEAIQIAKDMKVLNMYLEDLLLLLLRGGDLERAGAVLDTHGPGCLFDTGSIATKLAVVHFKKGEKEKMLRYLPRIYYLHQINKVIRMIIQPLITEGDAKTAAIVMKKVRDYRLAQDVIDLAVRNGDFVTAAKVLIDSQLRVIPWQSWSIVRGLIAAGDAEMLRNICESYTPLCEELRKEAEAFLDGALGGGE